LNRAVTALRRERDVEDRRLFVSAVTELAPSARFNPVLIGWVLDSTPFSRRTENERVAGNEAKEDTAGLRRWVGGTSAMRHPALRQTSAPTPANCGIAKIAID